MLLGDRDWITQCFAGINDKMKGVDVGPEHEFGQCFADKAISFSFGLPGVTKKEKQSQLYTWHLQKITIDKRDKATRLT